MSHKQKTIQIQPPLNTSITAKTHCIGASRDGTCSEAQTCALHVRQMTTPAERPMFLPRVGANKCHFRVEVAK